VAAVVVEPPVLAVVDRAYLPVLAHRVQLPLLARLPVLAKAHLPAPALRSVVVDLAHLLVLVPLVLARVPVVGHLVVEPEVLLHLRSRQSFSAAMARSSP
jgi:hypothetical protein